MRSGFAYRKNQDPRMQTGFFKHQILVLGGCQPDGNHYTKQTEVISFGYRKDLFH